VRGDAGTPVRLRFTKLGKVRFVSHRDLARALERAFRIEQLPLAFTQGFSPRPKVSFGLALGVGHESTAEYLDLQLVAPVDLQRLPARLSVALPDGIDVTGAAALVPHAPALQESVTSVEFELTLPGVPARAVRGAVERALASGTLPVATTRKGNAVVEDLRPGLLGATVACDGDVATVAALAATRPRGLRPVDLLVALRELACAPGPDGGDRVLRTCQWIERDGSRHEPLDADRAPCAGDPVHHDNEGIAHDRRDHAGGHGLRPEPERVEAVHA
jgi:radical SAM-linked protein